MRSRFTNPFLFRLILPSKVTTVQSVISEKEPLIRFEEPVLLPQFQYLLDEERAFLPPYISPVTSSENLLSLNTKDMQTDWQQWHLYQTPPEPLAITPDQNVGPWMAPKLMHTNQRVPEAEELTAEGDGAQSRNCQPSPEIAAAICSMVEDPYFDTALSSPSSDGPPMAATEETGEWTMSPVFSTPSFLLNDQTLEPNSPASG